MPAAPSWATRPATWAWWKLAALLAVLLLVGGVVAWRGRVPALAWYYLRGLKQAGPGDRDLWVERVAGLDRAAVPGLLHGLAEEQTPVCANVEAALDRLAGRWGAADPRVGELAGELADAFPHLGSCGQQTALHLATTWAGQVAPAPLPSSLAQAIGHLLGSAAGSSDSAVHTQALELAAVVLDCPGQADLLPDCRELIQASLHDSEGRNRQRAVPLALHSGLGLLDQVLLLLNDPVPEVRREAMVAARSAPESVVKTENLLHWLHDPDDDVRRLCEAVLRGRNLSEEHLRLGRLLTDERPAVRLQVLAYLHQASDLEPGVWLRLLSIDPEPAVRAAAIRAAVADTRIDLSDRLDQITQSDPSPTVVQLARYYLSCQQQRKLPTLPRRPTP